MLWMFLQHLLLHFVSQKFKSQTKQISPQMSGKRVQHFLCDINREIEEITPNWKWRKSNGNAGTTINYCGWRLEPNERRRVTSCDVVFKLCLSTLIGNLLLKEFFIFPFVAPAWGLSDRAHVYANKQHSRFSFRQSLHPSCTHISISPLALSNKTSLLPFLPRILAKLFFVFLTEHVAFILRRLAASLWCYRL